MNKKKKIILVIGIFIILVLLGSLGFYWYGNKKQLKQTENQPNKEIEELNYNTVVYKCSGLSYEYSKQKFTRCEEEVLIPTKTENAKVLDVQESFVLYKDDGLRIYNLKNKEYQKIKLKNEYSSYTLNLNSNKDNVEGIIYDNIEKDYGYYDIKLEKNLYDNKYRYLTPINELYILGDNGVDTLYILKTNEEKVIGSKQLDENAYGCSSFYGNNGFILYDNGCANSYVSEIYNQDFKLIVKDVKKYDISSSSKLYNLENDKVKVYDLKGNAVNTYSVTGNVLDIFYDYYLVSENELLYIRDYNGYELKLGDFKENTYYHYMISGYYEENALYNDNEKEAGYYFIVQKDGEDGGIEYYFNPKTKEIKSWVLPEIGGYAKPVLYLYPEKETKVEVNFQYEDKLTTTYPKFKDKWEVIAKPNGDLYDLNGKYYYGLYWEETKNHTVDFKTGFYVDADNAISFLEEKLHTIGLSDRERNEFIMYWLPILEKNNQSLVYFELTEERESYNKIEISPKPDSLLRVAMYVKKVDKKVNIKEQKLPTFDRIGFVAVEWGGILYN